MAWWLFRAPRWRDIAAQPAPLDVAQPMPFGSRFSLDKQSRMRKESMPGCLSDSES